MMSANPMQKKSRNSFLLGMVITLLITGAIIACLLLALKQKNEQLKSIQESKVMVYTLNQNVKAGQILTSNMFSLKNISVDAIPSNATAAAQVIDSWFLQTKEGEKVYTDQYGLYLDRSNGDKAADTIMEVRQNTGSTVIEDSKGNKIANGEYYVEANGVIEKVTSLNSIKRDDQGMYFIDTQGNDKITRVYQEAITGEFYTYKVDTQTMNSNETKTRVKEYLDIKNVPILARVDMNINTVITSKLVVQSSEIVTDDTRQEEYNMITLPVDLMTNDYVDIRFRTPDGQNFIVVSKAQVDVPMNADGTYVSDTIRVNLREDEILAMSSAMVEAYGIKGSELYVTKYVDPAMQEAALPTYTPNAAVTVQIQSDPNIVEVAREELASRYSDAAKKARNDYLQQIINNMTSEEYQSNIQNETNTNVGNSINKRKQYLESLGY